MPHIGKALIIAISISFFVSCVPATEYMGIFYETTNLIDDKIFKDITYNVIGDFKTYNRIQIPESRKLKKCDFKESNEDNYSLIGLCLENSHSLTIIISCNKKNSQKPDQLEICNSVADILVSRLEKYFKENKIRAIQSEHKEVVFFDNYISKQM